jgi:hypothetical protein
MVSRTTRDHIPDLRLVDFRLIRILKIVILERGIGGLNLR